MSGQKLGGTPKVGGLNMNKIWIFYDVLESSSLTGKKSGGLFQALNLIGHENTDAVQELRLRGAQRFNRLFRS